MPLFLKSHSYGEYVFDWAWAEAYERHGIEYYPKRLFKGDDNSDPKTPLRERQEDELMTQILNKSALVTLWVDPGANQIVKYTFDNVTLDFFPAAWLVRPTTFRTSMTMTQAFKDVWLPRDVEIQAGALAEIRDDRKARAHGVGRQVPQ